MIVPMACCKSSSVHGRNESPYFSSQLSFHGISISMTKKRERQSKKNEPEILGTSICRRNTSTAFLQSR